MLKRVFDFLCSFIGLLVLSPLFLGITVLVIFSSKGGAFYKQVRVGKNLKDFKLYKFRTMYLNSDRKGLLTIGGRDSRITPLGYFLRKYKLDELPQLINVLIGDMSMVGPRPEVRKYVDLYSQKYMKVLSLKPGITDIASIEFRNENELLSQNENPEAYYINEIMPQKLELNLKYASNQSLINDILIILKTFRAIIK